MMNYIFTKFYSSNATMNFSDYNEIETLLRLKSDDEEQAKLSIGIKNIINFVDKDSKCNIKGFKRVDRIVQQHRR